jgi:hypothetical protein
MFIVNVHKFVSEDCDSKVQTIRFNSILGFASWVEAAKRFFAKEVEIGSAHSIHIAIGMGEENWEIHFDMIRGQLRVSEFNVTPDQEDCGFEGMVSIEVKG